MNCQGEENIMNIVIKKISGTQKKKIVGDGGWTHIRLNRSPTP